jgi:hypothetical protein
MTSLHDPTRRIGQMVTLVENGCTRPARIVNVGIAGVLLDVDGQYRLVPTAHVASIHTDDPV